MQGSRSICVFKTHHNRHFSRQIVKHYVKQHLCFCNPPQSTVFTTNSNARVKKYPCLQNSPQSSLFTTNSKALVQTASLFSKPATIDCFHHKKLSVLTVSLTSNPTTILSFTTKSKARVKKYMCLQNPPQSSVFTTNAKA